MGTLIIRNFEIKDEDAVINLWRICNIIVPQNDPKVDIEEKMKYQSDLFFVGIYKNKIISSIMIGYDGHRGWIYYLAVNPEYQRKGFGSEMMDFAKKKLKKLGCQKINLQVRKSNKNTISFYKKIGFKDDDVIGLGLRIKNS